MQRIVKLNKTGISLVEVLIALVVLLLVSLAMMQTALVSIESNMINVLREEAVAIAEMRMNDTKNLRFTDSVDEVVNDTADSIADDNFAIVSCQGPPVNDVNPYPVRIERNVRNLAPFNFGTRRTVIDRPLDANKQVIILVRREYRGVCYSHEISSIIIRRVSL